MKYLLLLIIVTCIYTHSNSQNLLPMGEGLKCQGLIHSMCVDSLSGYIYAGGYFDVMNEVKTNNIAVWNGVSWDSLKSGVKGAVFNIQSANGILYCAGNFTIDSNLIIKHLAAWDGSQWQALYSIPPNGSVWRIQMFNGALYASGSFTSIDGVQAKYIAKYENGIWSAIGNGFDQPPQKMEVVRDTLFFYGYFSAFNGDSIKTPGWIDTMGNTGGYHPAVGELYYIKDMFSMNDSLFGIVNDTVVKWNGMNREPVFYAPINILHAFGHLGNIYITYDSNYTVASESYKDHIMRKVSNGQLAEQVGYSRMIGTGASFRPEFSNTLSFDSTLYIGGNFYSINSIINPGIASYKNQTVSNLGKCGVAYVDPWQNANALTVVKDSISGNIYVGGTFIFAGNKFSPMIAMWDGNQWHSLDSGFTGSVRTLAIYDGELYAGGNFKFAGTNQMNGFAKWNGTTWQSVFGGCNKSVNKLMVVGSDLIIGGSFTSIGGNLHTRISRFDGSNFYDMQGSQMWGNIYDLHYYHNKIYASAAYDDIYYLNGSNWIDIGLLSMPWKMLVFNDTLIVGSQAKMYKVTDNSIDTLSMINANFSDYFNPLLLQNKLFAVVSNGGMYQEIDGILVSISYDIDPSFCLDIDSLHTIIGGFFPSITNSSGTRPLNNIGILEYLPPTANIINHKDTICEFQYEYYYCVSNDLFAKYDWSFPGGLPDSSSHQNPVVQYTTAGAYPVSLTISNLVGANTYSISNNIIVQNCITSINEPLEEMPVLAYPNPFSDQISIENNSSESINVTIRNVMGSLINQTNIAANEKRNINSDGLAKGFYIVELRSRNIRKAIKLIKQ